MKDQTIIGIVAHESRAVRAEQLSLGLRAVAGHVDDGTLGCAGNHIQVLQQMDAFTADWCCILEDDAVPVREFRGELARALQHAPTPIVGLYLGTGNPSGEVQIQFRQAIVAAQEQRLAWIVGDCLIGSVGYVVYADLRDDMLDYITGRDEELPLRISRWAQDRGIDVCYTAPSLVDHEDHDTVDGPSTRSPRKAWWHGSRREWHTTAVQLGYCPAWSAERTLT